ncbi:MAG: hypothetical protein A3F40_02785 [Chlamydiae bacterium RIFCSPHIGHO2_12_FULL_27_8]|nr:MAG: hypothetical protein A3F40_02785 [Chlamydiae bacterium RIFCSPHIGHO2_12_FULL_27_8]
MNFLKRLLIATIFLPFLGYALLESELEDVMKKCVDEGHTHGMVIGVIDENGTRFYKYGNMGINDQRPVDQNTLFETGSVTKIFTSLLLSKMVEDKEVRFDDPIEKFFPDEVTIPSYKGKKITLLHLANHTAGYPYMPENFIMSDMFNPFYEYDVKFVHDLLSNYKLTYAPGTKYQYSNISIAVLGYILSKVSNKHFEVLLQEKLLNALDMKDSKVILTDEDQLKFAKAHIRNREVPHWDISDFYGAGGLHSTPKDLARFIEAYLGFYKTDLYDLLQKSLENRVPQDVPYLDVGSEWNITYQYTPEFMYHSGITGGHHVFVGFCPTTKKGIVLCSNSCALIADIGKAYLNANWYLKKNRQQVQIVPMMLPKFMGEYKDVNGGSKCTISLESNGHLSFLLLKWGYFTKVSLNPSSEKDFFIKSKPCEINFILNENDESIVEGMKVKYYDDHYEFKKIN